MDDGPQATLESKQIRPECTTWTTKSRHRMKPASECQATNPVLQPKRASRVLQPEPMQAPLATGSHFRVLDEDTLEQEPQEVSNAPALQEVDEVVLPEVRMQEGMKNKVSATKEEDQLKDNVMTLGWSHDVNDIEETHISGVRADKICRKVDMICGIEVKHRDSTGAVCYDVGAAQSGRHWIENNGFIDLGFSGPKFTWTKGNNPETQKCARLDRVLCNMAWRTRYQEGAVQHLLQNYSDHPPLLINTRGFAQVSKRPKHEKFNQTLNESWLVNTAIVPALQSIARALTI
ncbi:hypothetical protein Cgig2_025558 [Carnegiea gigantea]|uniref:Uncharacterized protein n=1 Tax=Carnegiea gigantea TaxID=171969 RepID=A0A9Q1JQR9_9CARY|nr:hypothetical protein Cgig2_025558 [Carnegiea gigantea]